MRRVQLALTAALLSLVAVVPAMAKVIHREKSLYRNIIVRETGDRRCLVFSVKRKSRNQTCMNLKDPKEVVFPYARMTFAGLLLNPAPQKMLMIGLGGGTISGVLAEVFPDMRQDLVEVDPAVVEVARQYFGFDPGERARLHILDGRVFTRRAAKNGAKYDLIVLDAFTGDYIPEHLMTREFLRDVKRLLTPEGVVVANTFSSSGLYDHESATYEAVFGPFLNFRMPGTRNRVIVAGNGELPDDMTMAENAGVLAGKLAQYSVELPAYLKFLKRDRDWDPSTRPLTDQFAPANLLRERKEQL